MELDYYRIEKAIKYLEQNFKEQPSLEDLAKELNLSSFHFQKMFKNWAGITPKKFQQFLTIEHIKKVLEDSKNIFNASIDSGLSSSSRLYDLFLNIEAISPKEYKEKGKDLIIEYGIHPTPFGKCLIAITDRGICNLQFIDSNLNTTTNIYSENKAIDYLKSQWPNAKIKENTSRTREYIKQIFNNSERKDKKLTLLLKGTNFQIQVWKALLSIPEGNLVTYIDVAKFINNEKASRAVGTAIGNNPIAYLIPCHRVINQLGVIGNYRWGTNRKKALIVYEASRLKS